MKKLLLSVLFFMTATPVQAAVNIFACEPEWGALAKEIGGNEVSVTTAITAQQDPHYVRAKPSLLASMRKAQIVICSGAELEAGWLPLLQQNAGNASVQPGSDNFIEVSTLVDVLEKPTRLDRADGDIHPQGNPHVHLNPYNILKAADALARRLIAVDAEHADDYKESLDDFTTGWKQHITGWEKEAAPLRGKRVVTQHKHWVYLLNWLGMQQTASLEPKPGIPPTPGYLNDLLLSLRGNPADVIVRTPFDDAEASEWLSTQTGTPAIMLPYTVGGGGTRDLAGMFDATINQLNGAVRGK